MPPSFRQIAGSPAPRSLLLVRGDAAWTDAPGAGADALVVDPADEEAVRVVGAARAAGGALVLALLPAPLAEDGRDVERALASAPDAIVLRGAADGRDVQRLGARLAVGEAEAGLRDGATGIIAALAAPAGLFALGSFAGASPRLFALAFDAQGFLDAGRGPAGSPPAPSTLALARGLTLLAARAAGLAAYHFGPPPADPAAFPAQCEAARAEGFDGALARAPGEVAIVHAAFARAR